MYQKKFYSKKQTIKTFFKFVDELKNCNSSNFGDFELWRTRFVKKNLQNT